MLLVVHVLLVAAAVRTPAAHAWGKEGHYMVCKIAESFLTKKASAAVKDLLPGWAGGDLAETCSWPDTQRFRYKWSSPLHFADSPGDCKFDYAKDASEHMLSLLVWLGKQGTATTGTERGTYDRSESLMFLAHFVGDVHQPLHCGHTDDLGGNTIIVHWYRRKSNLHHVWDVNVIETAMKNFYNNDVSTMIQAIQRNITDVWSNEEKQWETCRIRTKTCADKYAEESSKLACKAYEGVQQDSILKDDYFFAALPVVQKRIAQGGVRLAAILNKIFSGNSRLQSS
ncbi:hypothetical protein HU200_057825 [Digitaria exilis]|uniref:Aspergillus nuclease S1 n=1 Tax=Digitaria exilis TaxID=1010633 RepID=A0A835AE98_9POAL|nr:hypothetical protein HU200_057825 [Digitaria exilis]